MVSSWVMVESCDRDHDCRRWEYCAFRDQRVLIEGEYVLIEKRGDLWPKWALDIIRRLRFVDMRPLDAPTSADILDALAGGES